MTRKISILLSLLTVLLTLSACTPPTISLFASDRQHPEECVHTFFDCLRHDDHSGADACLHNLSTLGLGETMPEGLYSQLYQYLKDSRSYSIIDQSASALDAEITIELTVLDFRKIEATLTETVTTKVAEIEYQGLELDDAQLSQLIETTLSELMLNPAAYYSTGQFAIPLFYVDDVWQMDCSDNLYSALFGYIV